MSEGLDRDGLARFYADRHSWIDDGVEAIFYLPEGAPDREIRFLEVNRMIPETTPLEPIDFGVGIGGADAHTLYVLDVTPSQWREIEQRSIALPHGWTLDNNRPLFQRDGK